MNSSNTNDLKSRLMEDSPAYAVLKGLMTMEYRKRPDELDLVASKSSRVYNMFTISCCGLMSQQFEVPEGHVRLADDGEGKFLIYGPGVHLTRNMFQTVGKTNIPLTTETITHGNRAIVTVKQGFIGYAEDMGQPVLLPPGMHEWKSDTMVFHQQVDVNNAIIKLGPYTVLTVDEGYAAITQNNGEQIILEGGKTHFLNHRNWKFEKFMTEKIQTDNLQRIEATSADNVLMNTEATVVWRITDVAKAARMSAETMQHDGKDVLNAAQSDIKKLRNDVLKQATASLAAFIGEIRYSDSFHISAAIRSKNEEMKDAAVGVPVPPQHQGAQPEPRQELSAIFDMKRMKTAIDTANDITSTYGVTIVSINIISATPADQTLMVALAKGAVAAAEAEQAETTALGQAKAARINAQGHADAEIIKANADAEAEKIRAEGAAAAAATIEGSQVAVDLARIDKTGAALRDKATFFFGAAAGDLPASVLSNPGIVPGVQTGNRA